MRIDLPSGNWVELRDPDDVTNGEFEDFVASMPEGTQLEVGLAIRRGLITLMVTAWSFEFPLPATAATIRSLKARDVATISAAMEPVRSVLMPDFGPKTSDNGQLVPGTPSSPSRA